MSGLLWIPIGETGEALVVLDAERRLYAGLARDKSYWHVVSPLIVEQTDADGNVVRAVGDLGCRCKGGIFFGTCYRTLEAEAFERADRQHVERPSWAGPDPRAALLAGAATFDAPAGAGEAVESFRG